MSSAYSKRRVLMKHRADNPSLDVFVNHLEALAPEPTPPPAAPKPSP